MNAKELHDEIDAVKANWAKLKKVKSLIGLIGLIYDNGDDKRFWVSPGISYYGSQLKQWRLDSIYNLFQTGVYVKSTKHHIINLFRKQMMT